MDKAKKVHVTLHDPMTVDERCPRGYVWSTTGERRVAVVKRIQGGARKEEDFAEVLPE